LLTGCQSGGPPPAWPAVTLASPPPSAALSGLVRRLTPAGFVPAAGAAVQVGDRHTTADALGAWRLAVPQAPATLVVDLAGHAPLHLAVTPPLARLNLPLSPPDAPLAGVLVDPRGAAVPGGTVVATAAGLPAGRAEWRADADGFWIGGLMPAPDVRLTAHGTTPGGVPVETTALATGGGVLKLARARPLGTPTQLGRDGDLVTLAASGLTTAPDELRVLAGGHEVAAMLLGGGRLRIAVAGPADVQLEQLGLPGPTVSVR